jgi:hypothetical protein
MDASKTGEPQQGTSQHLTAKQQAQLDALAALPDDQINTEDIPEVQN